MKIWMLLLFAICVVLSSGEKHSLRRQKRWDMNNNGDMSNMFRGTAGVDYPDFKTIPTTNFRCDDQVYEGGLYADVETQCQVYHVCHDGRKDSFLCGKGTIFNQEILACDYWYSTDCEKAPSFYYVNQQIGNSGSSWVPPAGGYQPNNPQPGGYQQNNPSPGSYQPNNPPAVNYEPNNPPSGNYQPNNPPPGNYQPNNPPSGSYQPNNPQPGNNYRPNNPQPGNYQPNNPQSGSYQPSNPPSGSYQPNNPQSGSYQPNNFKDTPYRPDILPPNNGAQGDNLSPPTGFDLNNNNNEQNGNKDGCCCQKYSYKTPWQFPAS